MWLDNLQKQKIGPAELPETWEVTSQLRFVERPSTDKKNGVEKVLQQMLVSSKNNTRWEDVRTAKIGS